MRHALTSPAAVGLLRAIVEDPADDVPRLLLADVLEEAGDPRGEFIHVQCELARMQEPWCKTEARENNCEELGLSALCDWCDLRRRERELFAEAYPALASGLPGEPVDYLVEGLSCRRRFDDNTAIFTFRRGFVASVTLTCADWCGAECQSCQPPGRVIFFRDCLRCHGTGRTSAHGPALVLAAPIKEVVLSDREPEFYQDWGGQRYLWHRSVGNARSDVPPCLYDRINKTIVLGRAGAQSALWLAALAWARQEAGLPALTR